MSSETGVADPRIEDLLQQNVRLKRVIAGLLASILLTLAGGAVVTHQHGEMQCLDLNGAIRAQFGVPGPNPGYSRMCVHDAGGNMRLLLGTHSNEAGSSLQLYGPGGPAPNNLRVELSENSKGTFFALCDKTGASRIAMGIDAKGETFLHVRDGKGNQRNLASF